MARPGAISPPIAALFPLMVSNAGSIQHFSDASAVTLSDVQVFSIHGGSHAGLLERSIFGDNLFECLTLSSGARIHYFAPPREHIFGHSQLGQSVEAVLSRLIQQAVDEPLTVTNAVYASFWDLI